MHSAFRQLKYTYFQRCCENHQSFSKHFVFNGHLRSAFFDDLIQHQWNSSKGQSLEYPWGGPIIDDSQQTGLSDLAGSKQVRNTGCQCLQCLQNFRFRKVSLPVHSCGNQEPLVRKFCEQTGLSSRVKYQSSQKFVLRNRRLCRFSLIGHVMMIRTPNYLLNKFMFNVSGGWRLFEVSRRVRSMEHTHYDRKKNVYWA